MPKLYTIYRHYVAVRPSGIRDSMITVVHARHVAEDRAMRMKKRRAGPGWEWTQQAVPEG